MKRVVSLLLCLVMCVSVFSVTVTSVYAASVASNIFTVKKSEFNNDRITYTISLKPDQKKISGAILKIKYDSTVLKISSDSGAIGTINSFGEFAANVTGYYEMGQAYNDKNAYMIAYMNPNGYSIGTSSEKFVKISFIVTSETRPVTDVEFYCEEFITDDGNNTNDIRKADGSQKFYGDSFLTLSPAEGVEVASAKKGLKFVWKASVGADYYNVYRRQLKKDGSYSAWKVIAKVYAGTTEYVDETVENGTEYYYSVETVNQYGKIEHDDKGLPGFSFGTITKMSVSMNQSGAVISWGALSGAESYSVHRNADGETDANGELIWKKIGETKTATSYEDEPLTSGVKYSYTVKAHKGVYTAEASVAPKSITFVASGKIVGYKINSDNIMINWSVVTGADRYRVYRKAYGESSYSYIGATRSNSFTDTNVTNTTKYYYKLRTVAENGDLSVLGEAYTVTKIPNTTKVTASLVKDHITVSWEAAELAEKYIIYRKTTTGNWKELATVSRSKTKYVDYAVESGVTYVYAVATKAKGFTTEISKVSSQVLFLGAPDIVGVSVVSAGLDFKFKKVEGAEKYYVYKRKVGGKFGDPVATITQSSSSQYTYTDTRVASGTQYVYGVKAVNGKIISGIAESDLACRLAEPKVTLSNAYTGVNIKWSKITGAEKYEIYYTKNRNATEMELVATVTGTSYIHKAAEAGISNYYSVKAVCGSTTSSTTKKGIYYLAAPKITEFKNYKASVQLKWAEVLGANEYIVYRKLYGETEWKKIKVSLSYTSVKEGGSTVKYVVAKDSDVTAGKKYVYTVVAGDGEDYSGKYSTGWSHRFLKNPTIKTVANSYYGPKITWSKASGATKYYVYRKTSSTSWTYMGSTTSTSYVDKTAKNGTKYYYAVKSLNGSTAAYHNTTHFNDICKTITYLAAPVLTLGNNAATSIAVSWSAVSGAEKYYVYRKAGSETSWTKVQTTTTTSYTDTNVKDGTSYRYMVKAVKGSDVSGYNTDGAFIKRLAAPKAESVTSTSDGVTFKWSKVTGASGYYVYRKTTLGSYTKIGTVKGSTTVSYLDASAKKGTSYTYIVRAYYDTSISASSSALKITDKY